jgi:mono/diheme cytochrome c family protein
MSDNNQPENSEPFKSNPAVPVQRITDENDPPDYSAGTYPQAGTDLEPGLAAEPGEVTQAESRPNYMLLGFGAVVILIVLVVAVVFVTGAGAAETPAPATLSQTAAEGKALFLANNCSNCHPSEGRAGGTGPRLSTTGKSDQDIINIVRHGRGRMPANTRLTDEELGKVIAYIRAIKPPPETK